MTKIDPGELARLPALFVLRRLAPQVQSDVLSDGTIAAQVAIEVSHPVKLPDGISIDRALLFSAFQKAIDGEPLPEIVDDAGNKLSMAVQIEDDCAILVYDEKQVRFAQAALLTSDVDRRRTIAATCLSKHTLTDQARQQFGKLTSKSDFTHDEFFAAANLLTGSPETFADSLRQVANTGTLSKSDFIPTELAHWDNVTAVRLTSETLPDYIANELTAERSSRLAQDPVAGFELISLTFAAPELVPRELLKVLSDDFMLEAVRRIAAFSDPFALAGAFDVCVDRAAFDARFIDAGDAILERLLSDPKRLHRELVTYATAFVIATAFLAEHQTLRRQPVFWRRLAAATHAALVTRTLGEAIDDDQSLFAWAMRISGKAFYFSILNDAPVEPRWRPDWISPRFVAANVCGRVLGSSLRLADAAPPSWLITLDEARARLAEEKTAIAASFPSVLQGGFRIPIQRAPEGDVAELYDTLMREPLPENFVNLTLIIHAFGFQPEAHDAALKAVHSLRTEVTPIGNDVSRGVLSLASFIAAQSHDAKLAEAVAQICIERIVSTQDAQFLLPTVATIVECAAATEDRNEAIITLARRLENLAFVAPPAALGELFDILRILQTLNENLSPQLGRAIATARLGMPQVSATQMR